ncbi:hypothetical protein DCS_01754 [Drechmeria coniospora]|uniref:Uncharacterized protein n=1 Tax=Drechmeria coniospora TaxID=98403 RepID=A0A151GU16_DRECN|nr:hypothetical protein DCS_01754 [Drechmeria coniospora]KYK60616.1 hypothetical protein DCS_01754 [Drechmeria coniospora]
MSLGRGRTAAVDGSDQGPMPHACVYSRIQTGADLGLVKPKQRPDSSHNAAHPSPAVVSS